MGHCLLCGDEVPAREYRAHLASHGQAFDSADPAWDEVVRFFLES